MGLHEPRFSPSRSFKRPDISIHNFSAHPNDVGVLDILGANLAPIKKLFVFPLHPSWWMNQGSRNVSLSVPRAASRLSTLGVALMHCFIPASMLVFFLSSIFATYSIAIFVSPSVGSNFSRVSVCAAYTAGILKDCESTDSKDAVVRAS